MSQQQPGGTGPLTRKAILAAALRMVDEDGIDGVSMRKLAAELGAGTMSLYHHVPNKEALLQGVTEAVLSDVQTGDGDGEPMDVLLTTARSLRRTLLAHPNAALPVVRRSAGTPESFRPVEATLGAFRRLGLGLKASFYAQQATVGFVIGHVLFELGHPVVRAGERGAGMRAELSHDGFPNLRELQPIVPDLDFDKSFEFGLEGLLEGLLEHEGEEPT
jgi:AcrR family transcriptional regulator